MMEVFRERLHAGAVSMGLSIDKEQLDRMEIHGRELLAWNTVANLTALKDLEELAEKQFLDVLPLAGEIPNKARVLDLGSGGGFPGIPLKIMRPDLALTLIDGRRKKVSFLKHVIRTLGLCSVEAMHIRSEVLAEKREKQGGRFDVVVSKAVSDLKSLIIASEPLLEDRGLIISMKGARVKDELETAKEEGVLKKFTVRKKRYRLPFSGLERSLIIVSRGKVLSCSS